jgi:hypothetical protein
MPPVRGKYPDRDYSLRGLGARMDDVEDTQAQYAELIAAIAKLISYIRFWAPVLAAGAVGSVATNRDILAALGSVIRAAAP